MHEIRLRVEHPQLEALSDRTVLQLLKEVAKSLRNAQRNEVAHLIETSDLAGNQKQSLTDRLDKKLEGIPAYYLRDLTRGSLIVEVSLAAVGIWLLEKTIGKAIQDAWERTDMYSRIVDYLGGSSNGEDPAVEDDVPEQDEMNIEDLAERVQFIEEHLQSTFAEGMVLNRFEIAKSRFAILSPGIVQFNILLTTPPSMLSELSNQVVDSADVLKEGQRLMRAAWEDSEDGEPG